MSLRKIGKILLFGIAGMMMGVLLLTLGVKLILDRAPQYQAEIKDWVHNRIGYRIAFSDVSPAFRWYGPELYFAQLELRSKDGQRVLARTAGGRVGIDFWQLFHSGKLFAVRVELDAPDITVERMGPDQFALASEIVLGGGQSSMATLALNDLPAGTLAIRRGLVTVQKWNSDLPELKLRDVNLDLRRAADLAVLSLNARLPAVLGGSLRFNGMGRGVGPLTGVSWDALASARDMSFPGWRQLLPEYLTRLDAGTGGFDLLASGRGPRLARATLDFSARGVVARLSEGLSDKFEQISGALAVTHAGDRWTLLGRRMRALTAGRSDPDSEFDVSWRGSDEGVLELRAQASYLRAEALLPLAGLMPQKELRDRLRDIAPTGEWRDMRAQLERTTVNDPWQLAVYARFHGVGFAPVGRAPGLRGLSGMLAGNESGGRVVIDTPAAVFNWPGQFPQPINLSALKTTLYWKRSAEEFLVATRDFTLSTHGASAHAKAAWRQPNDGSSPILTVASTLDNGNVTDAHLFFPHALMPASALAWLDRAFIAGRLVHADAIFDGPVRRFPFHDGGGLFLARCSIEGMILDYHEGWRRIEGLAGHAEFRNEGMTARLTSGHAGALVLESADARFVDLRSGELQIHADTRGDADDALQYLRATPLDEMAEHGFSEVEAKGALRAAVDLYLPFKQFDRRRVLVHVNLDGATVNRKGATLAATDVSGEADIDGAQVARADMRGRALGGAFQMTTRAPRNRPLTRTQLDFHGTFSGESLRAALSLPATIAIGGQADWHGVLKVAPDPGRERTLKLNSSLTGLELKLPEPLAKPAGSALPTSVDVQWPQNGGTQVRVVLGSVLRGDFTLGTDASGPKLDRAAVTFGAAEPAFSDAQTVNVGGNIERLDLAGWLQLAAPGKGAEPLSNYLRSASIAVARIDYLGFSFLDVALELTASDGGWRIGVGGPNVAGTITLPGGADPAEPWNLEFKRLNFVDGPPEVDGSLKTASTGDPGSQTDPRTIPAIAFHAAEMTWGDRHFGEVRATLVKANDGISLKQLKATGAAFAATANGEWRGKDGGLAHIEGSVTSTDVADTLKQLGFAPIIEAKSGRMEFDMNWIGAPTGESLESATGRVQVALDKGQIVGLKPGAGRVLGLASLAELPRRLALDFSDLTDKGFAFDTIRGSFNLKEGSAYTDDVLVKGPAAEIGLIGRVGLKNKDYDQTAVVTGNVGSSPLPLAGFAAGPVIGGAILLFTQVFKQPLKGLVRGYYRITGSWDSPTVERIKSAGAAAATAEAPK
ncbi:MAG: YhdP family protein [Steroidobacteraceae bacterium]